MGQIYTMYIDFPLEGNTPNPRAKSLGRRPHIFRPWKALEASGDLNRPGKPLEAPGAPGGPLEAPGGPWRVVKSMQCTLINPHIFSDLLGGPPGGGLAPSCSKSAGEGLEAGGPPGNPPKSGPFLKEALALEAPGSSWRPLAAPAPRDPSNFLGNAAKSLKTTFHCLEARMAVAPTFLVVSGKALGSWP